MSSDKPVKQQQAADYLGVSKLELKNTFAHGVDRTGTGEGKVLVSAVGQVLADLDVIDTCPTCRRPWAKTDEEK